MGTKVTFDPTNYLIIVTQPPDSNGDVVIDFKTDVYSDGKEDWLTDANLIKFRFPIEAIGGQPTPTGFLGTTFFISLPWRIRPYEADHRLRIVGNVFMEDGSSPLVPTTGGYTVAVEYNVSNIVDRVGTDPAEVAKAVFDFDISSYETWGTTFGQAVMAMLAHGPDVVCGDVIDAVFD